MVKRAKSPEAAEDEKYFTVWQPYPLNANWELENDCIEFCRWIASCIGTEPLHGLHYKPKARGMVLLEIDKKYPHNGLILGEHRWSEFLRKPSPEEDGRVSQIFHSLYSTGREAQKDGWKRIHVEAAWFRGWTNTIIKNPYPDTYWCPVPNEDMTNKPLCRHLPKSVKPPPPQAAPPVVGSAGWVEKKTGPNPNSPQAQKSAWAKGKPAMKNAAKSSPATRAPATNISSTSTWNEPIITSKAAPTNQPKAPKGAWGKGGPAQRGPNGPATATSSISPTSPISPASSVASPPPYPPGLAPKGLPFAPPGLVRKTGSGSTLSSGSGSGSNAELFPVKAVEDLFEEHVMITLSPSQDRELYGIENDESPDPNAVVVHPWEQQFVAEENLWDNADATEENLWGDEETKKPAVDVVLCPVHGKICKKGICREMSKILKEQEKAKAAAEKLATKGTRKNGRRGGGWRQNPSEPESAEDDANANGGFSQVGGRNKGGRKGGPGRGRQIRDDNNSATGGLGNGGGGGGGGGNATRSRSDSTSSKAESVATSSAAAWDTASVGPWG
ncbi:hypothetical protein BDZ94DRAFT_1254801 [Collybia nuda]|uniref:Uncharacterized protein n=1 Tax=Collybia nuda TaxID=64659 RepID=A0A9P5YAL5_9AGAR|nr:hypothetical protein BDZ94DRAFT_1254801 [Collybia nuda]